MTELDLVSDLERTPATLFASPDPALIVAEATRVAGVLAPVITDRHLYAPISGKKYPTLEAWTLLGMLMRTTISPHVTRTWQTENGWGAHAEARTLDGQVVSAADAYCMRDEEKWETKPHHQVASMASTRACSRAMRLPLSFVMSLTGYEVTAAEEMEAAARGETVSGGHGVQPGWKDLGEQQRGHADLGKTIAEHGLRQWVAEWISSKGYGPRPWAKGQLTQLRRAIEQEIHWRQKSDPPSGDQAPPGVERGGSDPMSEAAESSRVSREPVSAPQKREARPAVSDPTVPAGEQPSARAAGAPAGTSTSGEEGERARSGNTSPRDDPSTPNPTSPPAEKGKLGGRGATSGTAESSRVSEEPPITASHMGEASPAVSGATSGEGSSTHTAGMPGDGSAVSPSPDQTSEAQLPTDAHSGTGGQSTSRSHTAAATSDLSSPTRPASEQPGRVGGNVERPIVQWFLDHPDVERRLARIHLRTAYPDEFDDIRTVGQMEGLETPRVPAALRYLSAQYDQEGA